MTFPVPKDVRAARDFELVLGQDEQLRHSIGIKDADKDKDFDIGEWVKLVTDTNGSRAAKLESGDVLATPANGCKVCWTRYRQGDVFNGQGDAVATGQLDLLSGSYQGKTKLFNTGGTFTPGFVLVPVYDATLGGILDAVDPASVTARQLACAVGKVIELANGVLHFESPASW